jgi:hypothetical protein
MHSNTLKQSVDDTLCTSDSVSIASSKYSNALKSFVHSQIRSDTTNNDNNRLSTFEMCYDIDCIKSNLISPEVGRTWFVERDVFDYSFKDGDSRRYFLEGNVTSMNDVQFTVEYIHPTTNLPMQLIIPRKKSIRSISLEEYLARSSHTIRCFDYNDIKDCNIFSIPIYDRI